MSRLGALWYRLRGALRPEHTERELDAEFDFHLDMEMQANMKRGLAPHDARQRARDDFGNALAVRDALRDARGEHLLAGLMQDARYALRRIARERVFSTLVIVTLALGIGWSTAIFSIVDTALMRPLAYASPEQLVHLWERREGSTMIRGELSPPEIAEIRAARGAFADVAGYRQAGFSVRRGADAQRLSGVRVTANFFSLLGVRAARGRLFGADDDARGAPLTALVSDEAWRTTFGADPSIVGKSIQLDGNSVTIVGILPPEFRFVLATNAQIWVPAQLDPSSDRANRWVRAIARLRPGVTEERAAREFDVLVKRMAAEHPETTAGRGGNLVSLRSEMIGSNGPVLVTLLIGVAALLLTGCANVAGLLLSRVAGRASELAVRRALGAERARVINQILIENLALAIAGGILGIGVAELALRVLVSQIPPQMITTFPFVASTTIDARVMVVAAAVSVLTGLLCGIAPAIAAARHAPAELLRTSTRSVAGPARWRLALVSGQLALTFVLVACSSLLGRSLTQLFQTNLGFRPERLLMFGVALDGPRYDSPAIREATFSELTRRVTSLPGVQGVAVGSDLPLEFGSSGPFLLAGSVDPANAAYARARFAAPSYFDALGISLLQGRDFVAADSAPDGGVIVSASLLREYGSRGARLGATIGLDGKTWRRITGVVSDVRLSIDQDPTPTVYLPLVLGSQSFLRFAVRTQGDPTAATPRIREALSSIDPQLVLSAPTSVQSSIEASRPIFFRRFPLLVTTVFSLVGMVLAAAGLFGVVAYSVSQRTREFGIRMALGASRQSVVGLSVREGLRATIAGVVIGVLLVLVAGRALSTLLYGVRPSDVTSYLITTAVIVATALLAAAVPARRAVAIPPSTAMRGDS